MTREAIQKAADGGYSEDSMKEHKELASICLLLLDVADAADFYVLTGMPRIKETLDRWHTMSKWPIKKYSSDMFL